MTDKQYIYSVARIRSKELSLLNKQDMEKLLSCKSYVDCVLSLMEKGWNSFSSEDITIDELLKNERTKTWELMEELVKDTSVFNTFLIENDFHNLKAAIKQVYLNKPLSNIYIYNATNDPMKIYVAIKEQNFIDLPEYMQKCAVEAYEVQMHTGDSQLVDIIVDKKALEAIYESGTSSGNEVFSKYAELRVAFANINIALRCNKTEKTKDYMQRAMASCKSLDINKLMDLALDSENAILEYLKSTVYSELVNQIKKSSSSLEKYCDNQMIDSIKPQKYNSFTISPLAAYVLAREIEMKNVRIILSGKKNSLKEESIRERLRELYV